jgi:hypothetical protein
MALLRRVCMRWYARVAAPVQRPQPSRWPFLAGLPRGYSPSPWQKETRPSLPGRARSNQNERAKAIFGRLPVVNPVGITTLRRATWARPFAPASV